MVSGQLKTQTTDLELIELTCRVHDELTISTSMSCTQKPCLFFLRLPLLSVAMTIFGKSRDRNKKALKPTQITSFLMKLKPTVRVCSGCKSVIWIYWISCILKAMTSKTKNFITSQLFCIWTHSNRWLWECFCPGHVTDQIWPRLPNINRISNRTYMVWYFIHTKFKYVKTKK